MADPTKWSDAITNLFKTVTSAENELVAKWGTKSSPTLGRHGADKLVAYGDLLREAVCIKCAGPRAEWICTECGKQYYLCCRRCCAKCRVPCVQFKCSCGGAMWDPSGCATCRNSKEPVPCCDYTNCNCCESHSKLMVAYRSGRHEGEDVTIAPSRLGSKSECLLVQCDKVDYAFTFWEEQAKEQAKLKRINRDAHLLEHTQKRIDAPIRPPIFTWPTAVQQSLHVFSLAMDFPVEVGAAMIAAAKEGKPYIALRIPFVAMSEELGFGKPDELVGDRFKYFNGWEKERKEIIAALHDQKTRLDKFERWYQCMTQKYHALLVNMESRLENVPVMVASAMRFDVVMATSVSTNRSSMPLEAKRSDQNPNLHVGSIVLTAGRLRLVTGISETEFTAKDAQGESITAHKETAIVEDLDAVEHYVEQGVATYPFSGKQLTAHPHQPFLNTDVAGVPTVMRTTHIASDLHSCIRKDLRFVSGLQPGGLDQYDSTLATMKRLDMIRITPKNEVLVNVSSDDKHFGFARSPLAFAACRNIHMLKHLKQGEVRGLTEQKSDALLLEMSTKEKDETYFRFGPKEWDSFIMQVLRTRHVDKLANLRFMEFRLYPIMGMTKAAEFMQKLQPMVKWNTIQLSVNGQICPIVEQSLSKLA